MTYFLFFLLPPSFGLFIYQLIAPSYGELEETQINLFSSLFG